MQNLFTVFLKDRDNIYSKSLTVCTPHILAYTCLCFIAYENIFWRSTKIYSQTTSWYSVFLQSDRLTLILTHHRINSKYCLTLFSSCIPTSSYMLLFCIKILIMFTASERIFLNNSNRAANNGMPLWRYHRMCC